MNTKYSIEIVPADRGWILEHIAKVIAQEAVHNDQFLVRVVQTPSDEADLVYFLPESAFRPLKSSVTVTYLAHKESVQDGNASIKDGIAYAAELFNDIAKKSDICISSSEKYKDELLSIGAKRVFKIHLGADTNHFKPKLKIGVVGRTYNTGRKGESLLSEIMDLPYLDIRFTGAGWPLPSGIFNSQDMARFYNEIDYLLVPSLIEGGPVPMLEALSSGCPVIAPSDIGLVSEFPHIAFKRGDAKDLRRVIEDLAQEKLKLRDSVINTDWSIFARKHLDLFKNIIDEARKTGRLAIRNDSVISSKKSLKVMLATHGSESDSKGGPSTRVAFLKPIMRKMGLDAVHIHNPSIEDMEGYDVIHVFNIWPPPTAMETITRAKKAGKVIVFSPIAMDLVDFPIFRNYLESFLGRFGAIKLDEAISLMKARVVPRQYGGESVPIEGIPNHFHNLRRLVAGADRIIFLSEFEKAFLTSMEADTSQGDIVFNGVSGHDEVVDPLLFKRRYNLDKYILCVGRIEYRKNQALLAYAARNLSIPLVLIGHEGDTGYLQYVLEAGQGRVIHIPRINDRAILASAYAGAEMFVLPSWSEGGPLAAIEAGMMGTPLILSAMSGEREYFGDLAIYINPANPDEIKDAIKHYLDNPPSAEERQQLAQFTRERYNAERHTAETVAVYRRALSEKKEKPQSDQIILDASSYLHYIRLGRPLSGVPLAEAQIIKEIKLMRPETRFIVYNDVIDRVIEVEWDDLQNFNPKEFDKKYWLPNQEKKDHIGFDTRLEFVDFGDAPEPSTQAKALEKYDRCVRWLLKRTPGPLQSGLKAYLGFWRHVFRISMKFFSRPKRTKQPWRYHFQHTQYPRQALNLPPGSRIISLGQGWLSNEGLLKSLIGLSGEHFIEPYVYDISYISGAHYSGWADNDNRAANVLSLLSRSNRVYTESKQVQDELVNLARGRNLKYKTIRTGLAGKVANISAVARKHDRDYVLFVSSFNRRKNHDFLVNVWRELMASDSSIRRRGVWLYLVGEVQGEGKYGDAGYQAYLASYNICVMTEVDDQELSGLYNNCLFTVFPSLQEGWGIPVQESLLHGKVCIVSNRVPSAEEIHNAALIKLSPMDFFGWRDALDTWVDKNEMRAAFEAKALEYQPPSWREIAERVLKG